ncbi:MAG TPA: hypothetical protein DCF63_14655 [Planctomycetaceae bacterium]|nr:hypothetical protein [Planctomycetaceae bacterium]
MSQSLVKNLIHLVFSTKHRTKWIPPSCQQSLWAYQAGIFSQWDSPAIIIGGIDGQHRLYLRYIGDTNHANYQETSIY